MYIFIRKFHSVRLNKDVVILFERKKCSTVIQYYILFYFRKDITSNDQYSENSK